MPSRTCRRTRSTAVFAGAVLLALSTGVAHGVTAAPAGGWSPEEQQFVYELNRARWDPSTVGLASGTLLPAPPLAISETLGSAARFRADEMATFDYFAHQSPVTGDWPNAVARDHGYTLPVLWPDAANNIESIHYGSATLSGALQSLIDSPAHRLHLMGQGWYGIHREIGVGAELDEHLWSILTATDGTGTLFLTGVAYSDRNSNGRMDLGEGLPGVTVTAGGYSASTNAGGGWAIPVKPGTYRVALSGGPLPGKVFGVVRVGRFNIGIDFVSGRDRAEVHAYTTCAGRYPTILGTDGNDRLQGTPGADVIAGLGGHDIIDGGDGHDILCGGPGDDVLIGGAGRDALRGGSGNDTCSQGDNSSTCEAP